MIMIPVMSYQQRTTRGLFLAFALWAFLLRSLIPAGFMPQQEGSGWRAMVICTGAGSSSIYVPANKIPAPAHKPAAEHKAEGCAFSASFLWSDVPSLEFSPAQALAQSALWPATADVLAGHAVKSYLSQGPPVSLI